MSSHISVIGCGYLGAVHAVCMASLGHEVVAVDSDRAKVELLRAGRAPFFEPGLDELLTETMATGRLTFTTDIGAVRDAAVHFVCVGTPQLPDSLAADTSQVFAAVDALAPHLAEGSLVVGKSTVPVGTAEKLTERLRDLRPRGSRVTLAWNPEFLREGFALTDTLRPDRIVYGVSGDDADGDIAVLDKVYEAALAVQTPRIVTDLPTAELVKVAANAFLATKISFINAMATLCDASGGDVVRLAESIGHDSRIGHRFLGAGVGFGGGCLPKDIRALLARADELGAAEDFAFLREIDGINQRRRHLLVSLVTEACTGLEGRVVTVLGASFKPHSDDVRDSPALDVAYLMAGRGAEVRVHDPQALDNARSTRQEGVGVTFVDDLQDALQGADAVVHLTAWPEYLALEPRGLAGHTRGAVMVDGRNSLDPAKWRDAGWTFRGIGRAA